MQWSLNNFSQTSNKIRQILRTIGFFWPTLMLAILKLLWLYQDLFSFYYLWWCIWRSGFFVHGILFFQSVFVIWHLSLFEKLVWHVKCDLPWFWSRLQYHQDRLQQKHPKTCVVRYWYMPAKLLVHLSVQKVRLNICNIQNKFWKLSSIHYLS